jgi:hypothetical protein
LHRFIKTTKKIVSFIVAFTCLLLALLEWVLLKTPSCVTLLAPKTMIYLHSYCATCSRGKFLWDQTCFVESCYERAIF